mmetsp:Transcript_3208/g.5755  ORF Transcript_3208/g.5755 Transcript_3208/m.5755 type:complete len:249 (+) Transcript_3208:188-934(+)
MLEVLRGEVVLQHELDLPYLLVLPLPDPQVDQNVCARLRLSAFVFAELVLHPDDLGVFLQLVKGHGQHEGVGGEDRGPQKVAKVARQGHLLLLASFEVHLVVVLDLGKRPILRLDGGHQQAHLFAQHGSAAVWLQRVRGRLESKILEPHLLQGCLRVDRIHFAAELQKLLLEAAAEPTGRGKQHQSRPASATSRLAAAEAGFRESLGRHAPLIRRAPRIQLQTRTRIIASPWHVLVQIWMSLVATRTG